MRTRFGILVCFIALIGCSGNRQPGDTEQSEDHHSFSRLGAAKVEHLDLNLSVNFKEKILEGTARYRIDPASADRIIFDTRDLEIIRVSADENLNEMQVPFNLGDPDPILGQPLEVFLPGNTDVVTIYYRTTPQADALQWLTPQQTFEKTHPFLFTQGQAILTRTWIPCQDSPGIRFTYTATISVPNDMLAVMSARNPTRISQTGAYRFVMEQPIPAYLMALAVGNLSFASLGERTGVYAEPGQLEAARHEFQDLEKMMEDAEDLYGPYLWERYDLIVLPPSFPFGGMENPRLTFVTPTIIAGDRSLTSLIAHELAHSWSGNLVTNATWDDFWLNEGFTVYFERRIMEEVYGRAYSEMLALLGAQDLQKTIDDLGPDNPDTQLKLNLSGRDPDDGMTDIAYEKGYLLLRTIEAQVGRERFDRFLNKYFESHHFQSVTSYYFVKYLKRNLSQLKRAGPDLESWIYNPGLPADADLPESDRFDLVATDLKEFVRIGRLDVSQTRRWSTHEWLHFIRNLPTDMHWSFYEKLDQVYRLSASGNSEILAAWLEHSIRSGYFEDHNLPVLKNFLVQIGRRKFLVPIYRALKEENHLDLAKEIFEEAKENYHAVSSGSLEQLLYEEPT